MSKADNTLNQLGGSNRLKVMIGAKDFSSDDDGDSLIFEIGTGANNNINFIKIKLEWNDTYTIVFSKLTRKKDKKISLFHQAYIRTVTEISKHEDIYNNMLKEVIESETGLYLSL